MKYTLIAVAVATTVTVWSYAPGTNASSKTRAIFSLKHKSRSVMFITEMC
ncbi:hypothetical protein QTN47_12935 [Danxiaibacter flavus]|uniref:Uncharacterized protein n=1 Tax=Danxiaibacter flavus TaxID=3049108 RepID=A0ABV3ZH58_9BACT|nr:hypothetical protein QNM32_12940 [Chitinophagaceae bacterium DXS]